jgi:hypothetical protein
MNVWEAHGSANFCKLIQKQIVIPKNEGKYEHTFTIEGILYLINRFGNIYQVRFSKFYNVMLLKQSEDGNTYVHQSPYPNILKDVMIPS